MVRWLSCCVLFALSACAAPAPAGDDTTPFRVVVRANGDDTGPRCEKVAAAQGRCRDDLTLAQAFEAIGRLTRGEGASPFTARVIGQPRLQVEIGPGTYRPGRTLTIAGWPGKSGFAAFELRGAGADKTVLAGTLSVAPASWRTVPPGETRLPAAARAAVRVAELPATLPASAWRERGASGFDRAITPLPLELLAGGRPMTLARWPNDGWALTVADATEQSFALRDGYAAAWAGEPELMVAGYLAHDWAFERMPVQRVLAATGEVLLDGAGAKFPARRGQRVRIENALSELDAPGEWYLDRQRRLLYFWPLGGPGDLAAAEITVQPQLLRIERSAAVTVANLAIEGVTGDAVTIDASRDIGLADLRIRNAGNRGVVVEGGHAVVLRRLAISDVGDGGVSLSGGDRRTLAAANHVVEGCTIERYARLSRSYRPAVAMWGVGLAVLRNRIADGPHSAIVFDGNDHRIEGNQISDVVTETDDAGAIYTGRDWTARGTVIVNNLLQNIYPRLAGKRSVMGVYLDDQASGATISRNVFANVTRAVFIGGGRDNTVQGNLFVASSPAVFVDERGVGWQRAFTQDPNGPLRAKLRGAPVQSEPYRSRYPRLAQLLDDEPGRAKYNRIEGNLFIASRDFEFEDRAAAGIELARNHAVPWTIFKTLRGPRARYTPADFEFSDGALPEPPRGFAALKEIAP